MYSGSKLHAVPWVIRVLGSRLWMVAALAGLEVVIAGGGVYTAWVMRGLVNAAVGGASYALRLSVVVFGRFGCVDRAAGAVSLSAGTCAHDVSKYP